MKKPYYPANMRMGICSPPLWKRWLRMVSVWLKTCWQWTCRIVRTHEVSDPTTTTTSSRCKKSIRSESGIVNVSVVLPPHRFSCAFNCRMCPDQRIANGAMEDMPRSYLSNEDAVRRASLVQFDPQQQVWTRLRHLANNGHPLDKIELRLLGGTFSSYPHDVVDTFITHLYYAVNTYYDTEPRRPCASLEEEHALNESGRIHIVGLGLETRPDTITLSEIRRFRRYGCTRVELGVQHTDNRLLNTIRRGHTVAHSEQAIAMLKNHGFKLEIHIMTDLPGATPQGDKECYHQVLLGANLIPDYLKDYPCLAVDFTELKQWKLDGRWKPYAEADHDGAQQLRQVLVYRQSITPPWVRVNRIQRDFARAGTKNGTMILGYHSDSILTNLGQLVREDARRQDIFCQCIRCCEVRLREYAVNEIVYVWRSFIASGTREYFISAEIYPDDERRRLLIGFARLRILLKRCPTMCAFSSLMEDRCALLRELHVYGRVQCVSSSSSASSQHRGIGTQLLQYAEQIAQGTPYRCQKMVVIAGVGVRTFYRKRGYVEQDTYMVKRW